MHKPVITIMGATASGKTRLAMSLYKKNPELYDLINVDSALIYKDMDIGTAKPSKEELAEAPHALVDIVDPNDSYNVGNFIIDVDKLIKKSHKNNKIPVLVGGTMMYYRSLLGQLDKLPASTTESREWVNELYKNNSREYCHNLLKEIDPAAHSRLHPNDIQRVGRVLEVWKLTGKAMSEISNNSSTTSKNLEPLDKEKRRRKINKSLFNDPKFKLEDYLLEFNNLTPENCLPPFYDDLYHFQDPKGNSLTSKYNLLQFAMYNQDREALHQDIENRLVTMFKDGLEDEVKKLYNRGDLTYEHPSVRCVGYRQLWRHFDGLITLEEAKEEIAAATRQLAKRQITWLRSWPLPFIQIHTNLTVEHRRIA